MPPEEAAVLGLWRRLGKREREIMIRVLACFAGPAEIEPAPIPAPADELIDAFGGNLVLAEIAGVRSSAISNWRRLGRLPPRLYLRIAAAGRERRIDVPPELFEETPDPRRAGAAA